jgi:hypothetical protein
MGHHIFNFYRLVVVKKKKILQQHSIIILNHIDIYQNILGFNVRKLYYDVIKLN